MNNLWLAEVAGIHPVQTKARPYGSQTAKVLPARESGASRKVRFSQPGVSFIFCNIHPEMSAAVVALTTPYFTVSAPDGSFQVNHVPAGPHKLEIWYEHSSESELTSVSRDLDIAAGNNNVPDISIHSAAVPHDHLNKYGEPYPLDKPEKY